MPRYVATLRKRPPERDFGREIVYKPVKFDSHAFCCRRIPLKNFWPRRFGREARRPSVLRERRAALFRREPIEDVISGTLRLGGGVDDQLAVIAEAV